MPQGLTTLTFLVTDDEPITEFRLNARQIGMWRA
jgi:hypothetical protein